MKNEEIDEFGFKKFDGDFLFVACSSDLAPERIIVERAIKDELSALGEEQVKVYSWDTQISSEGFDQRRSMQKNIPHPSSLFKKLLGTHLPHR